MYRYLCSNVFGDYAVANLSEYLNDLSKYNSICKRCLKRHRENIDDD